MKTTTHRVGDRLLHAATARPIIRNPPLAEAIAEVLQNCRRAGATWVDIDTDGRRIAISDNGCGMKNPESLFTFGRSDWPNEEIQRERVTGLGLYGARHHQGRAVPQRRRRRSRSPGRPTASGRQRGQPWSPPPNAR